jgi:hypothetical protein
MHGIVFYVAAWDTDGVEILTDRLRREAIDRKNLKMPKKEQKMSRMGFFLARKHAYFGPSRGWGLSEAKNFYKIFFLRVFSIEWATLENISGFVLCVVLTKGL